MAKSDAERFGHRCPYTDKPCLDFACSECEVEARERQWAEELERRIEVEDEQTETWNGINGQVVAPKGTFDRIYNEAKDDDIDI